MKLFDYIVIGGGSAGCVVASRLSENPNANVLLLEAGPEPRTMWIRMPAGVGKLLFPGKYNWGYFSEPEGELGDRRIYAPRGKTLGGTSIINGMAYIRGQPQDYNEWRQLGNVGWAWDDVLPVFRKSERFEGGSNEFHGGDGELSVTSPLIRHPAVADFITAGVNLGLPRNDDFNGPQQEGIGFLHHTIRDGQRHSTGDAFLMHARSRENLSVETEAHVDRIAFDGKRAIGVHYKRGGVPEIASARGEIILCAGAIDSPRILMRSGIGPADELHEHGIDVVHESIGVGRNLQDHFVTGYSRRVLPGSSMNHELRGIRRYLNGMRYLASHSGPLSLATAHAGAFIRSMPEFDRPDLQVMFRPLSWVFNPQGILEIGDGSDATASVCHLRPVSRGNVGLRSADPEDKPVIRINYLDDQVDVAGAISGIRWVMKLFNTEPFRSRLDPAGAPDIYDNDDAILDFIRANGQSMHHWCGTVKMGKDRTAVVDDDLSVHGVEGLRVADASIIPMIPSGNTNAPAIMIGEKAAQFVRDANR